MTSRRSVRYHLHPVVEESLLAMETTLDVHTDTETCHHTQDRAIALRAMDRGSKDTVS
jgi:hypothetical protein